MMGPSHRLSVILVVLIVSNTISCSEKLQSSQVNTLLRIQSLLINPSVLSNWNKNTQFCNLDSSPFVTVVCYENNITQLQITGEKGSPKLPQNFSIDSLVTTLVKFPSLKVLTLASLGLWGMLPAKIEQLHSLEVLNISSNFFFGDIPKEISSLTNLQGIILDDNKFTGQIPDVLGSFPALNVLSLRNNSFDGTLPKSLSKSTGLRVLSLADNQFLGEVPDLKGLKNLQVLDLENNSLGPKFPLLENRLVTLILRNNKFRSSVPDDISSYYQLEKLDISSNKFMGPFPMSLLSLSSIEYLNIAENKFTGMFSSNLPCNNALKFVDLSSDLLTGDLPDCLKAISKHQIVRYQGNCLNVDGENQHPNSFCKNEALAAGIVPFEKKQERARKVMLVSCIVGGVLAITVFALLICWLFTQVHAKEKVEAQAPRVIAEKASAGYPSKLLSDARYITKTMKVGSLNLLPYRTFSLEELEAATNNFSTTAFMGEGSHGAMYRGQLRDGSLVAIRCIKMKQKHDVEYFMPHIELISQLRHGHLVSAVGHCFEFYMDDSSVSRLFLVFEYVSSGTLRSWISAGPATRKLNWSQRIAVAIGITKGIQFLHTAIIPGIFSNNLRITDILLDHNLTAKISSYNLSLLAENIGQVAHGTSTDSKEVFRSVCGLEYEEKADIYDFGVILLEVIMGIQIKSRSELNIRRNQLQASLEADDAARRSVVAAEVRNTCSDQSLKTMMEICGRCIIKQPSGRPSIEDILWNLQFAAQVQEAWQGGESRSSKSSPPSPPRVPKFRLTYR